MGIIDRLAALSILGLSITLFAADITDIENPGIGANMDMSIDSRIEDIKNAAPENRRELMNRLKEDLAKMNQEERMEAISRLREKMHAQKDVQLHGQGSVNSHSTMEDTQSTVDRQQYMQIRQKGEMEHMYQMHGVDQYRKTGSNGTDTGASGVGETPTVPFYGQR